MQSVHAVSTEGLSRVVFTVDCTRSEHEALNICLRESQVFSTMSSLGSVDHE
jgi:hypothetical protein